MISSPDDPLGVKALDFGDYKIVEFIAKGSFGYVYRAEAQLGGTSFAFKFLNPELLRESRTEAHFCQEGARKEIFVLKDTPGVVRYHHLKRIAYPGPGGAQRMIPYWIMDFVNGEALDRVLWPDGYKKPCPPSRSVRIAYLVAKILSMAHEKGVIHCDIKPNNIMVQRNPHPGMPDQEFICITDWATALRVGEKYRRESQSFHQGNILYAPPEVIGEVPDEKYDVFSVAMILFEMLTGRMPAPFRVIVQDSPESRAKFFADSGIDYRLQGILAKCFHEQPTGRPSMRELAVELLKWLQDDCKSLSRWLDTEAVNFGQFNRSGWSYREVGTRSSALRPVMKGMAGLLVLAGVSGIAAKYLLRTDLPVEPGLMAQPPDLSDAGAPHADLAADGAVAPADAAPKDLGGLLDLLPQAPPLCWKLQAVTATGIGSAELTLHDVWGAGKRSIYVGGQYYGRGAILSSSNAGASWVLSVVQKSKFIYAGWATQDNSESYAVGESATILKSADAGASWHAKPAGVPQVDLTGIWGTPAGDAVYVIGTLGTILESRDHGESWQRAFDSPPSQATLRGIWGRDRGDLWVVSLSGEILHGQPGPGGLLWQEVLNVRAEGYSLYDIWGSGPHLYAVGTSGSVGANQGGVIFSSSDGGRSWQRREVREALYSVSGDGPGLYAAGLGRLEAPLRGQHTDWQAELTEPTHVARLLRGLWGRGERLYAVGDRGVLFSHQTCGGP